VGRPWRAKDFPTRRRPDVSVELYDGGVDFGVLLREVIANGAKSMLFSGSRIRLEF
jgi:hypothetical protein